MTVKKRMFSLLLALLLCAGMFPLSASAHPFTDVGRPDWYNEAVDYVYDEGIFGGVGNGRFSPNNSMTRAQFVQVLANNTSNYKKVSISSPFSDVRSSSWYYDTVLWAYENNLASGTSSVRFSPDRPITREDLVTLLYRYAQRIGASTTIRTGVENRFSDFYQVSSYAKEPMRWALTQGIITGSNGKINPKNYARRCEVAQIFYNAWDVIPPGSELEETDNPEPSAGDPREALHLTHNELKAGGYRKTDEGLSGSWIYEYDRYPNALFLMPMDYDGFSGNSKPHAILTGFGDIWPALAGKSTSAVKTELKGLAVEYSAGNPFLSSASGYYGYYDDGEYTHMILLDRAGVFDANDMVAVSFSNGGSDPGKPEEPASGDYVAALGKSFDSIVQEYGPATLIEKTTEYGSYYSYYSFKGLPEATYRFYRGNSSETYEMGEYPPMSFTAPIGRAVPELEGVTVSEYADMQMHSMKGGEFHCYWSDSPYRGYNFSFIKGGMEYGGFVTGQEETLRSSVEVIVQSFGV